MRSTFLPLLALAACPKEGGPQPTYAPRADEVLVVHKTPIRCSLVRKEEGGAPPELADPRGCNASVRFHLEPSGTREVVIPFFRDATRPTSAAELSGGSPVRRSLVLRDPGGERLWSAELDVEALPWSTCPEASDAASVFDFRPWRFLVVRVQTRDELGNLRPLAEAQPDTLAVTLTGKGGDAVRPVAALSPTHDGVWVAAWCASATTGAREVALDVRGAYQLEIDRFPLPDLAADTYTFLDYTVEPIPTDEEF